MVLDPIAGTSGLATVVLPRTTVIPARQMVNQGLPDQSGTVDESGKNALTHRPVPLLLVRVRIVLASVALGSSSTIFQVSHSTRADAGFYLREVKYEPKFLLGWFPQSGSTFLELAADFCHETYRCLR